MKTTSDRKSHSITLSQNPQSPRKPAHANNPRPPIHVHTHDLTPSKKTLPKKQKRKQHSPQKGIQTNKENQNYRIPPSNRSKVKSSVQRGLRQRFVEAYPGFEPYIDEILPKKAQLDAVKLYHSLSFFAFTPYFIFLDAPHPDIKSYHTISHLHQIDR